MPLPRFLKSDLVRMMLIGFLIGTAGVVTVDVAGMATAAEAAL